MRDERAADLNCEGFSDINRRRNGRGEAQNVIARSKNGGGIETGKRSRGNKGIKTLQLERTSKVLRLDIAKISCGRIVNEVHDARDDLTDGLSRAIRIRADSVAQGCPINDEAEDIPGLEVHREAHLNFTCTTRSSDIIKGDIHSRRHARAARI